MDKEKGSMERIREHFEEEAPDYDGLVPKLAPRYAENMDAMVSAILRGKDEAIKVVDLGCGTGNVALEVKKRFPNAQIICVDVAAKMLEESKKKLKGLYDIEYFESDVRDFDFQGQYDAVLAQLSLHHINKPEEKKALFKRVFDALVPGGAFIISDVILGSTDELHGLYMQKWIEFMQKSINDEEIDGWIEKYHREDTPFRLVDELDWLKEAGFQTIDIVCKYYGGAVYLGIK